VRSTPPTHSEPQCLQASATANPAPVSALTSSAGAFDRKAGSSASRCGAAVGSSTCSASDQETLAFLAPAQPSRMRYQSNVDVDISIDDVDISD